MIGARPWMPAFAGMTLSLFDRDRLAAPPIDPGVEGGL